MYVQKHVILESKKGAVRVKGQMTDGPIAKSIF